MKKARAPFPRILLLSLLTVTGQTGGRADVITDWNSTLLGAVRATSANPPRASRQMAMMHLAMYDAVNGIDRQHRPYLVAEPGPSEASKVAAANAAARVVLDSFYSGHPAAAASISAQYDATLAGVPEGPARTSGLAWGTQVGQAMLAHRAGDGAETSQPYTAAPAPGIWRPTPPAQAAALLPHWGKVVPFAMTSTSQFRPYPPPALSTQAYSLEYQLTRDYGSAGSAVRSSDQTEVARFWADGGGTETPPGHWMSIARGVASERALSVDQNARLFALLGLAVADSAILCWDTKYTFNYWRPITAIREADSDGNPATTADPAWTPLIATPPFPEYTSGHSTFSRSSATTLARFFGTDAIAFSTVSDGLPGVTRQYPGFGAAADEAGISRIYGGIHFQSANIAGQMSGHSLAVFLNDNFLTPLHDLEFGQINKVHGACSLEILVTPGQAYSIQASSDFETWEQLGVVSSDTGLAHFIDVNAPAGKRFYRALPR